MSNKHTYTWYVQLGLIAIIGMPFYGCVNNADRASSSYAQCIQLEIKGDIRGAWDACNAAIAADPTSKSGKEAAEKLITMKLRYDVLDSGNPQPQTPQKVKPVVVDRKVKITSLEDAKKYAPGVWTATQVGQLRWHRYIINAAGTCEAYAAFPARDNWGEADKATWELFTSKDLNTGERYYGIKCGDIPFFYEDSNTLLWPGTDGNVFVALKRGDVFPFSK